MSNIISSLLDLLTKFFSYKESEIDNIEKVDVVKNKKNLARAVNYAEYALLIAERYSLAFCPCPHNAWQCLLPGGDWPLPVASEPRSRH